MFSLHLWYFHLHDSFSIEDERIESIFHGDSLFYSHLLLQLKDDSTLFAESQSFLDNLSLEQLLLYKKVKIMHKNKEVVTAFINSLTDQQAYIGYRAYLE